MAKSLINLKIGDINKRPHSQFADLIAQSVLRCLFHLGQRWLERRKLSNFLSPVYRK